MTWRGNLAGYTGTLILEEVDEDEHVARYRFQGTRDGATATATLTVRDGEVTAEVHPGHGADLAAGELAAAAREALAGPGAEAPAAPPAHGAARRRRALVAAGAAAAVAAWALKGRR
jgi:hypothetical protein